MSQKKVFAQERLYNEEPSTPPSSNLDAIINRSSPTVRQNLPLAAGRVLNIFPPDANQQSRITIAGRNGMVELEIEVTENGPRLRFESIDLQLTAAGDVAIECERLHLHAKKEIVHESDGDLTVKAAGNARTEIKGESSTLAKTCTIKATRGDARIEANDDVKLKGERIKLNC